MGDMAEADRVFALRLAGLGWVASAAWKGGDGERRERPKGVPPIMECFRRMEGEATTPVTNTGTKTEMKGNPARSPSEAAYPQGDAVS